MAQIYEFTNTLQSWPARPGKAWIGRGREAAELLVQMMAPMLPHLAEDCWARLGYNTLLADHPWPEADPALLVDDRITIAVQVNGKRRDELTVAELRPTGKSERQPWRLNRWFARWRAGRSRR